MNVYIWCQLYYSQKNKEMSDPTPIVKCIWEKQKRWKIAKRDRATEYNVAVLDQNLIHSIIFWNGSQKLGLRSKKKKKQSQGFQPMYIGFCTPVLWLILLWIFAPESTTSTVNLTRENILLPGRSKCFPTESGIENSNFGQKQFDS